MKYNKIETEFPFDKNKFKVFHPVEFFKINKAICTFLEKQIKLLKKECQSAFKWQYYKGEILIDWGKWSHQSNKILRQRIKETEKDENKKLNKLYKYAYQYWWQTNFYLEILTLFVQKKPQKKSISLYFNNRKLLEKTINEIQNEIKEK